MTNDFSGGLRGLRPPATFWQPFGLLGQLYNYLREPWVRGSNRILWEPRSGDLLSPQVLLFELYSVTGQQSLKFFLK